MEELEKVGAVSEGDDLGYARRRFEVEGQRPKGRTKKILVEPQVFPLPIFILRQTPRALPIGHKRNLV